MTKGLVRVGGSMLAGCLVFWGCSAPARTATQDPAPAKMSPDTGAAMQDPQPTKGAGEGLQAQDAEWRRIAEEAFRKYSLQDQQKISESNEYYRQAVSFKNAAEFDKAKDACQKALQAWPENLDARKLLGEVNSVIVGGREQYGAGSIAQGEVDRFKTQVEQAQIEISNHIRNGERFYNIRQYEDAIREFAEADFKIKHIPYEVEAMKVLQRPVEEWLRKSKDAAILEKARVDAAKKAEAEAEVRAHELARRREVLENIAHLLELAYMSFDQKKFDKTVQICNEILVIDPHYTVALELKEDAQKARHREEYYEFLRRKVENWKQLTDSDDEAVIPYSDTVRFPSAREWEEISKRITQAVIKTQEGVGQEEDPDILAINRKLDTMKIDMQFEGAKLEDIVAFVRDFTGMNILVDQAVRDKVDLEKPVTFKVKDLVLKNTMKLLLSQFGLDFHITEEKVVLITTPQLAGGKPVLELHDIRDILVKIQDFPGPKVELTSASGGGTPLTGATFTLEEPKQSSVSQEQIVDLIKENIAPGSWEGEYTIEMTPNQQLLVNHTRKTHRELREFLQRLRSYTGTMVSITARFLAAFDDFLDDVGVDIINRPPAAGFDVPGITAGAGVLPTSIDEPSGELGPGFVTNESARLESYDLRAQTFHSLMRFDPLTGIGIDPMSNRLFNQGGLGMQYQWLGEQALQIVLRALHKSSKATIVQAPRVTVFNTQRSHIMALTQIAYVQDLEPQISTAAAAYDPVIGILTQGVVLDVRPIVSNDRKYVTLELRPSLAELQVLRAINIVTGGAAAAGTTLLQLPWLILQKAETTVTVPDRGTLMISGFKDILMRDASSGVPFLENIPILNFFFTRKAKSNEKRRLMILVTPEIIDLAEHEDRNF